MSLRKSIDKFILKNALSFFFFYEFGVVSFKRINDSQQLDSNRELIGTVPEINMVLL